MAALDCGCPPAHKKMKVPIPKSEIRRLEALRNYHILDSGPEREFDDVVKVASHICGVPFANLVFADAGRQWFHTNRGVGEAENSQGDAFCARVIESEEFLLVEDATADPRFADRPLVAGEDQIRFCAGAPLLDAEGESLGALCVMDRERAVSERRATESARSVGAVGCFANAITTRVPCAGRSPA